MFRKQKKKSSKDWGAKTYRIVLVIKPLIVWRFLGDTLNHSFELQNRCVVFGIQKECWLFAPNHQKNIHDFLLKNNVDSSGGKKEEIGAKTSPRLWMQRSPPEPGSNPVDLAFLFFSKKFQILVKVFREMINKLINAKVITRCCRCCWFTADFRVCLSIELTRLLYCNVFYYHQSFCYLDMTTTRF